MDKYINWIDCSERLPENPDTVIGLFLAKNGLWKITLAWYYDGVWRCGFNADIRYWLPLDALPTLPPTDGI